MLSLFMMIVIVLGVEGYTHTIDDGCNISKCGENGPPIRFPFRLKPNQPKHCGYPGFEVSCNHLNQTVLQLPMALNVVVKKIDYKFQKIHTHDPNNCFPAQLPRLNLSVTPFNNNNEQDLFALFNCSPAETNRETAILLPCLSGPGYQVYATDFGSYLTDELTSCVKIDTFIRVRSYDEPFVTKSDELQRDLWLKWLRPDCQFCEVKEKGKCMWKNYNTTAEIECVKFPKTAASNKFQITGGILGAIILPLALAALYRLYYSQKLKKEDQVKVEKFLEDYKELKPSRYSFSDIKKITNNFKEKLGKGAYGTVFKGMLSNEIFVAIKVLESSIESSEEFLKEVGTMALIHHINVVRLVGFCADGIKRALVYEFLPNESLEKFIFWESQNNSSFLGWKKLQDIALGIAKGIEYLHEGCDHQILHFDIKPRNILLDHNFNPKIADFGLAKLCPKNQSKVSMTNARGTMGYIAPEVFSRNFGNVSSKSDVYSFGMLLLEIVSGRKNNDLKVQNTNQTYFPEWIYDRLCRGEELGIKIEVEEDAQIMKKLTIVGLSCIQWSPIDRPPMKTVVPMLAGNGDTLPIPPNPFASIGQNNYIHNIPARTIKGALEVISEG